MSEEDVTEPMAGGPASAAPDLVATDLVAVPEGERYEERGPIGAGGMGEVELCRDRRTGRFVARKSLKAAYAADPQARSRFVREALVQAQLEHPAIVPVYDLGAGEAGRAFFTMKRVRGETLEQALDALRRGDADAGQRFGRHRLLTAFVQVCRAIAYAHERGVVHRDLKPSNVMLGPYGEVYVLDWGLAKVRGATIPDAEPLGTSELDGAETFAGAVFGTPGYMAPEQACGLPSDARADVFALGAILFELLTLEPLLGRGTREELVARARRPVEARPSRRSHRQDVPPELEVACLHACAFDPAARFGSAGELADVVEAFLAGDRDLELRKELSALHLSRAREAAARAQAPGASTEERGEALAEAGRAIALAPDDEDARRLLVDLLTRPPTAIPAEVREAIETDKGRSHMLSLPRVALVFLLPWLVILPAIGVLGIRSFALVVLTVTLWLGSVAVSTFALWRGRSTPWSQRLFTVVTAVAVGATSVFYGPLVVVPVLAASITGASMLQLREHNRRFAAACYLLAILVPTAMTLLGVHPVHVDFVDGNLVTSPGAIELPRELTLAAASAVHAIILVAAARYTARYRDTMTELALANQLQSWQLAQLVPRAARASMRPPSRADGLGSSDGRL